jgi:CheY-like chemotaxis protein
LTIPGSNSIGLKSYGFTSKPNFHDIAPAVFSFTRPNGLNELRGKMGCSFETGTPQRLIPDRVSRTAGFSGAPIREKGKDVTEGVLIAILDDDNSVRKAIKRLIKSGGLSVVDFASAEDFLNSGCSQDAACLILDVRLPGMSGLELQSRLVAANCRIPIIFISAYSYEQERVRALGAGAVDFLQKPFSEEVLFRAINYSLAIRSSNV